MKQDRIAASLDFVGDDLLRFSEAAPPAAPKRPRPALFAAACAAIVAVALPLGIWAGRAAPKNTPDPQVDVLPLIADSTTLTGMTEKSIVATRTGTVGTPVMVGHDFPLPYGFIVQATLKETLPSLYDNFGLGRYYVARFTVDEVLSGDGLPAEVYCRIPESSGEHVFDRCDTYIMVLTQIGIERYPLVNTDSRTVEYFPMMMQTYVENPRYCACIGFKDGVVDEGFFCSEVRSIIENGDNETAYYPVSPGDTLERVKQRIADDLADPPARFAAYYEEVRNWQREPHKHFDTAATVFVTPEEQEMWRTISAEGSTFYQSSSDTFTRVINGFMTTEEYAVEIDADGTRRVRQKGEPFTDADRAALPDIGAFIEQLDLDALTPPHTTVRAGMKRTSCQATGWYTKVNGRVYGAVRVLFRYESARDGTYDDDIYWIARPDGTIERLENDAMRAILGDDIRISSGLNYNRPYRIVY